MNKAIVLLSILLLPVAVPAPRAEAADPEGCLSCHRYHGLARLDKGKKNLRLFHIDSTYYDRDLGPHARLRCTDCHDRGEVEVIPHKPVRPVDCTRACHLDRPDQVEVRFSHRQIVDMLDASVHQRKALQQSNAILGDPLRADQAHCLLCHSEPMFRPPGQTWVQHEAPIQRCNVCHTEQLPVKTSYYYWHVFARSRPAHSNQDTVRYCAVCHGNPKINEHFQMPDTVISYLASFHGKATMLGSQETANCLDCHVGSLQNIHMIQSHHQADAPTSPAKIADTCRSPSCHPTAGHRVSSAAVHLDLATSRGIEFFIACLFILLILFTFGPSVVLTGLELLQIVLGRHDPDHDRHARLAHRLSTMPEGRRALRRFTPHQRVQHWLLVVCFAALVLTGFPIKFADTAWARWLIDLFGGLSSARKIHRGAGALLLLGFAYHMVYIGIFVVRQNRTTGRGLIRTILDLPMVMNPRDMKHMLHLLGYLLFLRPTRPKIGRFSAEEKFEYFGVFWGTMLLGVTGLMLWGNATVSRFLPGRILTIVLIVHSFEAFLALLHVGILHLVGVIFSPAVFPLSSAMFTGNTPAEELAESHGGMLEEIAERLHVEPIADPKVTEVKNA